MLHNQIRDLRLQKGYSSDETANAIGITRQALGQIESGKVSPSTVVALRLSHLLSCRVEDLFWEEKPKIQAKYVHSGDVLPKRNTRVFLANMDGKWVARSLEPGTTYDLARQAHGIISQSDNPSQQLIDVDPLFDAHEYTNTVFISGCDIGLGLLAAHTTSHFQKSSCIWLNATNREAIEDLEKGQTHIAAVHFSSDTSSPSLKNLLSTVSRKIRVFEFAKAEIGWICQTPALSLPDMRLVNRPLGSGARKVLDEFMICQGISQKEVTGYSIEVSGHLSIASAISENLADIGIGHAAAAASYGLSFVPMVYETCALIVPEEMIQNKSVERTLQTMCSATFRKELACLGPYDNTQTGVQIQTQ